MPEKYTVNTTLTKKKLIKRINGGITEYRPSMNVLSVSRFMRKHREESIYYGKCSGDKVQIFYHKAKKRDGGSTGFFGQITENDSGCEISGTFRKPLSAYISAGIFLLASLFCALGTYAAGSNAGALVFVGVGLTGVFVMLYDNHKKYLIKYLEKLSKEK